MNHVRKGSDLEATLQMLRKSCARNKGNRTKGRQVASADDVKSNDGLVVKIRAENKPFWVPATTASKGTKESHAWPKQTVCATHEFPGEYRLYEFPFSSLKERFKNRKKQNNTNAVKSQKFRDHKLQNVKTKSNRLIQVHDESKTHSYVLARIVPRTDPQGANAQQKKQTAKRPLVDSASNSRVAKTGKKCERNDR